MKTYTFKLPKTNSNTINYSIPKYSYEDELKALIANNIADKYPWLASEKNKTYNLISCSKPSYSVISNSIYEKNAIDYANAIDILDKYAAKKYNKMYLNFNNIDSYDFEIEGTPVRIFDDMIQIGNHMFAKGTPDYYASLSPSLKKTIIDITIKLNK